MCIFTDSVDQVNSTRIFARLSYKRQAIVYDMYLATSHELAMVLPIPVTAGTVSGDIEFVDLSDYADIFSDIEALFPLARKPAVITNALGLDELLEVVEVGVFEASFVPSPGDFQRLDSRFRVQSDLFEHFPDYRDFGFVVFKLKPGQSQVHPMAFWFPTREHSRLFYPTVHVHDGQVHDDAEFHHTLFAQGLTQSSKDNKTTQAAGSDALNAISTKSQNLIAKNEEIFRKRLSGTLPNRDTFIEIGN